LEISADFLPRIVNALSLKWAHQLVGIQNALKSFITPPKTNANGNNRSILGFERQSLDWLKGAGPLAAFKAYMAGTLTASASGAVHCPGPPFLFGLPQFLAVMDDRQQQADDDGD
jgi:hypothetical protein